MSLKVEVTGNNQAKKSAKGNDYVVQEAYIVLPSQKYPVKIEVLPPKGQPPYAPGDYTMSDESFSVGLYGKIEVRPHLVPMLKAAK
jgi:hypothetical protein